MNVIFDAGAPDAAELRPLVQKRASFVMRRLRWLVPQARVCLVDLNGPRGGADKHCRVELHTDGAGRVVVSGLGHHWHEAIDRALDCAVRQLMRSLRRSRPQRRGPFVSPAGQAAAAG